jgi:hypothetical protein
LKPGEVDEAKLCGVPARPSMHGSRAVFDVKGLTFSNFARMLRSNGRFVVDQTGLEGLHDLHFEWDSPDAPASDSGTASDPLRTPPRWRRSRVARFQQSLRLGFAAPALQSRLDCFFLRPSSVFPRCPAGMRPMGVNRHRLATFLVSRQVLVVLARSAVAPLR